MSTLAFQGIGIRSNFAVRKRVYQASTRYFPAVNDFKIPLIDFYSKEKKSSSRWLQLFPLLAIAAALHLVVATAFLTEHEEKLPEITKPQALPMTIQISSRTPPAPVEQSKPQPKNVSLPKKVTQKKTVTENKPAETPTSSVVDSAPAISETPPPSPAPIQQAAKEEVVGPRSDADYLNNPAPSYPQVAVTRKWEGKVLLNVRVFSNGTVDSIELAATSGKKALDDAAIKAVERWRFVPAKRGKESIDGWVQVPIEFKLS
jgi:protein TonB